jgi:hypothetical protein
MDRLNGRWHERASQLFGVIVMAHWAEHLLQAWQIFVLKWPRPKALGLIGYVYPWLVTSEFMHYGYALVMLIGLWVLRKGFTGRSHTWWTIALGIQFWHHIEHLLLQGQALAHHNLFGAAVPMSVAQLWIPRVELHLFYNAIVFLPMVVAMYLHLLPNETERARQSCSCALRLGPPTSQAA